jgi:hypothetical protein
MSRRWLTAGSSGHPVLVELERYCFLDDADLAPVAEHRGDAYAAGFGLQLVTVRSVGRLLADPLGVPTAVVDYVAVLLPVEEPSVVKRYTERRSTRFEHQAQICVAYACRDCADGKAELSGWVADWSWTTGDGPKALFDASVGWLPGRRCCCRG